MEDGYRLEISDLESRWFFYLCSENKGTDQLGGYPAADLHLCVCMTQLKSDRSAHVLLDLFNRVGETIFEASPNIFNMNFSKQLMQNHEFKILSIMIWILK